MASNGSNGSLHIIEAPPDTVPAPGCPGPYLCEGLQQMASDLGLLRNQMDRVEANQSMLIDEMRRISLALGLGVKPV